MTFQEAEAYIESVPRFTKKRALSNTEELLGRLGHPEEGLKIIHVAGTNGKGSVCAYLESCLRGAGYRTGLFTSPHLVRISERIQIDRVPVSDGEFTRLFERTMQAVRSMEMDGLPHPAYFELLFAMGMLYFSQQKVDFLVMETGLGGRLDATNAVKHPILTVITSISLDHTEYLGSTIPEIAGEKAGIIKKGVPVVYDAFRDRGSSDVIRQKAREMDAPSYAVTEDMITEEQTAGAGIDFALNNRYYDHVHVNVPFFAGYQAQNCAVALTAAAVLRQTQKTAGLTEECLVRAVDQTRWAGRMEQVARDVVVDGAHNPDGIRQFLNTVKQAAASRKVSLLFSAVSDKHYEEMIREICTQARFSSVVTTSAGGDRRVPSEQLAAVFRSYTDCPVFSEDDVEKAYRLALLKRDGGILFCAGSLYLAGAVEEIVRRNA